MRFGCETTPQPEYRAARPAAITRKGERAKHQPDPKDKAGLDHIKPGCA